MNSYEIWIEGFVVTGGKTNAHLVSVVEAETFQEACDTYFSSISNYDSDSLTFWGCRLFDNEPEARKAFG